MGNLPKTNSPPDRFLHRLESVELPAMAPDSLCNQSEWDELSKCIWRKCVERQQTKETYRNKMLLWLYLIESIEVVAILAVAPHRVNQSLTLTDFRFRLISANRSRALQHLFGGIDHIGIRFGHVRCGYVSCVAMLLQSGSTQRGHDAFVAAGRPFAETM